MNYKELQDLIEKKKAARRALARKQRKAAKAPDKLASKPTEEQRITPESKVEEAKVEETQASQVTGTCDNICEAESLAGITGDSSPVEETPKKKTRKKKATSEVVEGAAE